MMTMIVIVMNVMIISQGLNDNGGDDIYFTMKILCVCHEKWSLPICPSWAPKHEARRFWPSDDDDGVEDDDDDGVEDDATDEKS